MLVEKVTGVIHKKELGSPFGAGSVYEPTAYVNSGPLLILEDRHPQDDGNHDRKASEHNAGERK